MLETPGNTNNPIKRSRAIMFSKDPHVQALTLRGEWCADGETFARYRRADRERLEYWMRRMWATVLLHDLKGLGLKWDDIEDVTGRSRQTWINVTDGKVPNREYFEKRYPMHSSRNAVAGQRGRPTAPHKDPDVFGVSRSFIYDVTQNLRSHFSIETEAFVKAFEQGMRVVAEEDFGAFMSIMESVDTDGVFPVNSVEEGRVKWITGQAADARDDRPSMLVTHWTQGPDHDTSWTKARPNFPLVDHRVTRHGISHREMVLRHMIMLEGHRWGIDAKTKGWAHRQRSEERFKELEQAMLDDAQEEVLEKDATINTRVPVPIEADEKPRPISVVANDGTNPLADLGFHTIPVNLDVHPNMVGSDGQVTFTVTLQYRDGVKVGHSIMAQPPVGA